jgi:hypothetical protein
MAPTFQANRVKDEKEAKESRVEIETNLGGGGIAVGE